MIDFESDIESDPKFSQASLSNFVDPLEFMGGTTEKCGSVIKASNSKKFFHTILNNFKSIRFSVLLSNFLDDPKYLFVVLFVFFILFYLYIAKMIKQMKCKIERLQENAQLEITASEANNLKILSYLENLSHQQILQRESEFLVLREQLMLHCSEVTKELTYLQNDFIQFKNIYNNSNNVSGNYESNIIGSGKNRKEAANHFLEDLISISSSQEDDYTIHALGQNERNSNNLLASYKMNKKNVQVSILDAQNNNKISFSETEEIDPLKFLREPFQDQHSIHKSAKVENCDESIIMNNYVKAKAFSDRRPELETNKLTTITTRSLCFQPETDIINYMRNNLTSSEYFKNMYGIEYDFEFTDNFEGFDISENIQEIHKTLEGEENSENSKSRFNILFYFHKKYKAGSIDLDQLEAFSEKKNLENIIKISKSEQTLLFQITILVLGDLAIFNGDRNHSFQLIIEGLLSLLESEKINENKFLLRFYFLNFFKFIHQLEYSTKLLEIVTRFSPLKNILGYYINILDIFIFIIFQLNNLNDKKKDRNLFIEFFHKNEFIEMYNKSSEIKKNTSNIYLALKLIYCDDECCHMMFDELFDEITKAKIENYYNSNISC